MLEVIFKDLADNDPLQQKDGSLLCVLKRVSRPRELGLCRVWFLTGDPSLDVSCVAMVFSRWLCNNLVCLHEAGLLCKP